MFDGTDPAGLALRNTQGEMRMLTVDLGEGRILTLTGPFSIDTEGYVSGRMKLKIEQIDAWRNSLAEVFPEMASVLETAAGMLSALTGGGQSATIDLTVNTGTVLAAGLIPLGEIPPI